MLRRRSSLRGCDIAMAMAKIVAFPRCKTPTTRRLRLSPARCPPPRPSWSSRWSHCASSRAKGWRRPQPWQRRWSAGDGPQAWAAFLGGGGRGSCPRTAWDEAPCRPQQRRPLATQQQPPHSGSLDAEREGWGAPLSIHDHWDELHTISLADVRNFCIIAHVVSRSSDRFVGGSRLSAQGNGRRLEPVKVCNSKRSLIKTRIV